MRFLSTYYGNAVNVYGAQRSSCEFIQHFPSHFQLEKLIFQWQKNMTKSHRKLKYIFVYAMYDYYVSSWYGFVVIFYSQLKYKKCIFLLSIKARRFTNKSLFKNSYKLHKVYLLRELLMYINIRYINIYLHYFLFLTSHFKLFLNRKY